MTAARAQPRPRREAPARGPARRGRPCARAHGSGGLGLARAARPRDRAPSPRPGRRNAASRCGIKPGLDRRGLEELHAIEMMSLGEFQGLRGREAAVRDRVVIKARSAFSSSVTPLPSPPIGSCGRRSCWPPASHFAERAKSIDMQNIADLTTVEGILWRFRISSACQSATESRRDFERSPTGEFDMDRSRQRNRPLPGVGGADDRRRGAIRVARSVSTGGRCSGTSAESTDRIRGELCDNNSEKKSQERVDLREPNRRILAIVSGGKNSIMIAWVIVLICHRIYISSPLHSAVLLRVMGSPWSDNRYPKK